MRGAKGGGGGRRGRFLLILGTSSGPAAKAASLKSWEMICSRRLLKISMSEGGSAGARICSMPCWPPSASPGKDPPRSCAPYTVRLRITVPTREIN